jgi:hypothetical protein
MKVIEKRFLNIGRHNNSVFVKNHGYNGKNVAIDPKDMLVLLGFRDPMFLMLASSTYTNQSVHLWFRKLFI